MSNKISEKIIKKLKKQQKQIKKEREKFPRPTVFIPKKFKQPKHKKKWEENNE